MKLCKHDLEEIRQLKALKKILKNSSKSIDKQKIKWYNKDIVRER